MSDPTRLLAGGTNPFTDDVDYAVATGSIVVVAAGNEARRHISSEYAPCEECAAGHVEYLCNDASDDSEYHKFADEFSEQPLIELVFDDDHYGAEVFDLTCWSAIAAGFDATKFKLRLHRFERPPAADASRTQSRAAGERRGHRRARPGHQDGRWLRPGGAPRPGLRGRRRGRQRGLRRREHLRRRLLPGNL